MECTIKDRGASEQDTILELSGESVVAIKGCLNFVSDHTDHYWLYDHKDRTFVSLYQEWTLCETLGRVLPHHIPSGSYALLHKGDWGFTKLDYNTPIWRKGDLKGQPTGGTARIQFGLKNRRFQPISISYTPPDSLPNQE